MEKTGRRQGVCGVQRRRVGRNESAASVFHRNERAMSTQTMAEPGVYPPFLDFGTFMELREAAAQQYEAGDAEPLRRMATQHPPATLFSADGATKLGADRVLEAYERAMTADGET